MGQRLNVEIWNNGEVLANAYYHWSAYTDSAAIIVSAALEYIKSNPIEDNNVLLYAIRVLEATGAGLTSMEIEHAKSRPVLYGATFADCNGRNAGLIGISDEGILETRLWEEGSAYIYLDEERVSFRVFWKESKWDWEKEQKEEYENEDADYRKLAESSLNFDDIKFSKWQDAYMFLTTWREPILNLLDKTAVITPIY